MGEVGLISLLELTFSGWYFSSVEVKIMSCLLQIPQTPLQPSELILTSHHTTQKAAITQNSNTHILRQRSCQVMRNRPRVEMYGLCVYVVICLCIFWQRSREFPWPPTFGTAGQSVEGHIPLADSEAITLNRQIGSQTEKQSGDTKICGAKQKSI